MELKGISSFSTLDHFDWMFKLMSSFGLRRYLYVLAHPFEEMPITDRILGIVGPEVFPS